MKELVNWAISISFLLLYPSQITARHCQLELAREAARMYYEEGVYERDLLKIISNLKQRFAMPANHDKQVVIFDVDDVALSSYQFHKDYGFGRPVALWYGFLAENNLPAVPHMKELYDHFKGLGYKVIFMTNRKANLYDRTYHNLILVGYCNFEKLILRDKDTSGAQFKEEQRIRLVEEEGYEIVCCIDDFGVNLTGAYVGHPVKIPNELYS